MLDRLARVPLDPWLDRLRELPFVRAAKLVAPARTGRPQADAVVALKTPTGTFRCPCELRTSHLSREVAERLVQRGHEVPGLLLLAPQVGRNLGDLFTRANLNFVDLAGNCHVRLGDRYLARIQGQPAVRAAPVDKGMRAASYAALLALLIEPDLVNATTRALAAQAGGISPQTAADLRARLVDQGLVLRVRRRHRWAPAGLRHALDLWLAGWSATLFPRLLVGRFRARERDVAALEPRLADALADGTPWRWGGGAAVARLTGHYRGDRTVVYLEDPPADLASRLRLVPDAVGPVLLVRTPGPLAFRSPDPATVHPLLVYADLLAEAHERAREAAGEVHARFLAPSLEAP